MLYSPVPKQQENEMFISFFCIKRLINQVIKTINWQRSAKLGPRGLVYVVAVPATLTTLHSVQAS